MIVVLDANIIVSDFYMKSPDFKLLFAYSSTTSSDIFIPEVVSDEIRNKFLEQFREKLSNYDKSISKLRPMLASNNIVFLSFDIDAEAEDYQSFLDELLNKGKIKLLPYPKTEHKDIVERALLRRKPFNKEGRIGYRDVLIWETIMEIAKHYSDTNIFFISNNTNDFADSVKTTFHPDLLEDLSKRDVHNIIYYSSLGGFINNEIKPKYEKMSNLELFSEEFSKFFTNAKVVGILEDALNSMDFDESSEFPNEYETISLRCLESIDEIDVIEVSIITDSEFVVEASISATCTFEFFIFKAVLYLEENPAYEIDDGDWNDHYALAFETINVIANVSFIFDDNTKDISSCEVEGISLYC